MTNGKVTILYFSHLHPRAERSSGISSTIDSRAVAFASEAKVTPEGNRILAIVARPSVSSRYPPGIWTGRGQKNMWEVFIHTQKRQEAAGSRVYPRDFYGMRDAALRKAPGETERERGGAPSIFASLFRAEAG